MKSYSLSHRQVADLCVELVTLMRAGVGCGDSLYLLSSEVDDPRLKELMRSMAHRMDDGARLDEAVEESGAFFPDVAAMLRVAEVTGRVEECFDALATYHGRRSRTEHQLRSLLLYPSVLLLVMLAVIVVLLTQVLPIFNQVYASLGGSLTGLAGGLLALGRGLNAAMPVLCALLAVFVVLLLFFSYSDGFRARVLAFFRKKQGYRGLSRKMTTARFAEALSMALSSGLSTDEALTVASDLLVGQDAARERLEQCRAGIAAGESFPHALRDSGLLPPTECRLLELGFVSGTVWTAAEEIARRLDREVEDTLERTLNRVEPAMVVTASLLVGVILLSVMLPLTHIMTAIG